MVRAKYILSRYFSPIVIILFLLPFSGAVYLVADETREEIDFTQAELMGIDYHGALYRVLFSLHDYAEYYVRHPHQMEPDPELLQLEAAVADTVKGVGKLDNVARGFGLSERWASIKTEIESALAQAPKNSDRGQQEKLMRVATELQLLMHEVGNRSNLVLDPELESYYLMSVIVYAIPPMAHELLAVTSNVNLAPTGRKMEAADWREIYQSVGRIQEQMKHYGYALDALRADRSSLSKAAIGDMLYSDTKIKEVTELLYRRAESGDAQQDVDDLAIPAHEAQEKLRIVYMQVSKRLQDDLVGRIHEHMTYRERMLGMLVFSLIISATLFWFARRNVIRRDKLDAADEIRAVLDTVADAIITMDTNGRITGFNPAAERMFGYTEQQACGKHVKTLMPELFQGAQDGSAESCIARFLGVRREITAKRQDDSSFPIELSVNRFETSEREGYVGSIRDITAHREAEEALSMRALEVATKNAELERARQQADSANRAKSEFLANVSHEIRTPMNGIVGMTDLLLNTQLTPKQLQYAMTVMGSAKALLALINDILDFSRNEAGKLTLELIPMNLKQLVSEVIQLLNLKALEKSIALTCDYADDVPQYFLGDPTRIRQILTNLVDNAIKFTAAGEVGLRLALKGVDAGWATLEVEVTDTGIGIAEDAQRKLFQKFSQADSSTTRKYGGTGLGLAICKQLAELMGGTIGVTSEAGKGSRFWFTMQLQVNDAPAAEQEQHASGNGSTDFGDARVLVVEDNMVNQFYATELLEGLGVQVVIAANGREAIEKAMDEGPFNLILMDCQMPEMDGYEATRILRQRMGSGALKSTPILAMTANAMQGDRERCLEAGMNDYAAKPLERVDILRLLQHWIG